MEHLRHPTLSASPNFVGIFDLELLLCTQYQDHEYLIFSVLYAPRSNTPKLRRVLG